MNRTLLMCVCALIFFGCGSKNNNPIPSNKPDYKALIIGKWKNVKDTIREYTNNKLTRTLPVIINPNNYFSFKSDGTGSLAPRDQPIRPLTYTLSGNTLTTNYAANTGGFTHPMYIFQEEIRELSSSALYIHYVNRETDDQGNVYLEVEESYYTKLSN